MFENALVTIYFPDPNLRFISKRLRNKARTLNYDINEEDGELQAISLKPGKKIIIAEYPENNIISDNCIVLNAGGVNKSLAFKALEYLLDYSSLDRAAFTESSGLLEERELATYQGAFQSISLELYLNEILGNYGWRWSDIFMGAFHILLNLPVSAGGTIPFTIFNREYAKIVFSSKEGLIIWSTVSSALANYAISLRSISQLPGLIQKDLPNIFKKVLAEISEKGHKAWSAYKILALTAVVLVANTFSIYASFTLAKQSSKNFEKEADLHNQEVLSILTITEIIGTIALVIRSTMNKFVEASIDDVKEITNKLRTLIFMGMNKLLSEERRLNPTEIRLLASGQLEHRPTNIYGITHLYKRLRYKNMYLDNSAWTWRGVLATTVQWGSYFLLGLVACYCVAYGILAAKAVSSSFSLHALIYDRLYFADFVAIMNCVSKGMLLGSATLNLSDFIKGLIEDNIFKTDAHISNAIKAVLYAAIFCGTGWNTWLSSSKIIQEFLWDDFIFDVIVGIGATASINYIDTCQVFTTLIQKAKDFYYRLRGLTPENDMDALIKVQILKISKLSPLEFSNKYLNRYKSAVSEEQLSNMQEFLTHYMQDLSTGDPFHGTLELEISENNLHNLQPNQTCIDLLNSIEHIRHLIATASVNELTDSLPRTSKYAQLGFFKKDRKPRSFPSSSGSSIHPQINLSS